VLSPEVVLLLRRLIEVHGGFLRIRDAAGGILATFGTGAEAHPVAVSGVAFPALVIECSVPRRSAVAADALAAYAATLVGEVGAILQEVDLLSGELLERYEEVTLLHEVSSDLGVVLDLSTAARSALERTLKAIPARLGRLLVSEGAELVDVASVGADVWGPARDTLAAAVAEECLRRRATVLVNAGQDVPGVGLTAGEPAVAVPVQLEGIALAATAPSGVLVLLGHELEMRFSAGEAQLAGTVARQLAVGLENGRLVAALREKERLEHELDVAAGIQAQLFPRFAPQVPGVLVRAVCHPAEQVGGDLYDFVVSDEGGLALVVADVTGHGVGPALIMAMTRSVLRAEFANTGSLEDVLTATNTTMWDDLLATGLFITVYAVALQPGCRRMSFVNGGHHPALLRQPDGRVEELNSEGMPIGLLPDPGYEHGSVDLETGSVVLVFSDGVVENRAPDGGLFGTPRLVDFLARHGGEPDLVDRLLATLQEHRAGAPQQDDVTVVELRIAPAGPSGAAGDPR